MTEEKPPSLTVEIHALMNDPVFGTDLNKVAEMATQQGESMAVSGDDVIKNVLFPMINGIRSAVARLATEVEQLRAQS